MTAVRLARAATGRERIVKFAGAYHGHLDGLLAQAGSGMATQALPTSPGVPASATSATVVVPWNDPQALRAAAEQSQPAAIIAEPCPANMGLVAARPRVHRAAARARRRVRRAARLRRGDQRLPGSPAGAPRNARVRGRPHVMGKIIGGGLPAAAVGGRAELIEMLAPVGGGLPGRDALGQPARGRGGAGDAGAARRRGLPTLAEVTRAARRGPARAADGAPGAASPGCRVC